MFVIETKLNESPHYLVGVSGGQTWGPDQRTDHTTWWSPHREDAQGLPDRESAETVLSVINKPVEDRPWPDATIVESDVYRGSTIDPKPWFAPAGAPRGTLLKE